jgi:hypothetical protein
VIPLWFKIAYTLFVCFLVPIYWRRYGPANFLWFSDIALLVTMPALWLESPLLASMMALAVALPEVAWNVDFFVRLTTGASLMGLSGYMFDRSIPLFIRALSLFHVGLPLLLVWMLYRLGYDKSAFLAQTLVAAIVCRSRICSATRSGMSTGFTGLVRDRRLEFPRCGSWHF